MTPRQAALLLTVPLAVSALHGCDCAGSAVDPAPKISQLVPSSGPATGGTAVTLHGTGFQARAGVMFGGLGGLQVIVHDATRLSCITPAHAPGVVDVVVANGDGQKDTLAGGFRYLGAPSIEGVAPGSGRASGGTAVTITGAGFQTGAAVTFGGIAATQVAVADEARLTCTTPAHAAGAVDVVVANPDGQSDTAAAVFVFVAPPSIAGVAPQSGRAAGGTAVTITGAGFHTGAAVTFGGVAATQVAVADEAHLTCTTPAHAAGAVDVVVANPDGQSDTAGAAFLFAGPPSIGDVQPAGGSSAGGTAVTITGAGFQSGAAVTFGGAAATQVAVADEAHLTCTTPAHAAGAVEVAVTNPDGQSDAVSAAFSYVEPPVVEEVLPQVGPAAGGTALTIVGARFETGATATLGGDAITDARVDTGETILGTAPALAPGPAELVVQNPDGGRATLAGAYTALHYAAASNPSTRYDMLNSFAIDGTHAYGVGVDSMQTSYRWRIEKRSLADGALASGFGADGVLRGTLTGDTMAYDVVLDGGTLYVAGAAPQNGYSAWRVEKRSAADGAYVSGFGSGGAFTRNAGTGDASVDELLLADGNLYVLGSAIISARWRHRVAKYSAETGAAVAAFGAGGAIDCSSDAAWHGLASDGTALFIVGADTGLGTSNARWRIEKRSLADGALDASFGTAGVVLSDASARSDLAAAAVLGPDGLYVAGSQGGDTVEWDTQWRVEKRSPATGALVPGFGTGGVVTANPGPQIDDVFGLVLAGDRLYVHGGMRGGWRRPRIERRDAASGALVPGFGRDGALVGDLVRGDADCGTLVVGAELYLGCTAAVASGDWQWLLWKMPK